VPGHTSLRKKPGSECHCEEGALCPTSMLCIAQSHAKEEIASDQRTGLLMT
jgi:hypothetical protein